MSSINQPSENQFRQQICDIGRRVHSQGLVVANEGNLSIRLDDDRVLCTPTLQSKGFLKPDDLCIVDLAGHQLAGVKKATSEIRLHLEIYRQRRDIRSVLHSHPPHVLAFAITGEPIPTGILPESEVFLGKVPTAPYVAPGSQTFADTIVPYVHNTNTIVLGHHGAVSYDVDLERALWWTEILDAYCRTLILAKQVGSLQPLSESQLAELQELRRGWGKK
jgi:L-fuculose-phosphate aldolase